MTNPFTDENSLRRLRQELAALNLDWERPPYPPEGRVADVVDALAVEVISEATSH